MSNFLCVIPSEGGVFDPSFGIGGSGSERYQYLDENYGSGLYITNVWYTRAYSADTSWRTEFFDDTLMATSKVLWAQKPKEAHRGESVDGYTWWQTVHTSIYDLTNRVLRVAVQETDDWYTFQVPSSGAKVDAYTKAETDAKLDGKQNVSLGYTSTHGSSTVEEELQAIDADATSALNEVSGKASKPSLATPGNIASLTATGDLSDSGKKPSDFAPSVAGGYLPLSGGTSALMTGMLYAVHGIDISGYNGVITSYGYEMIYFPTGRGELHNKWYYLGEDWQRSPEPGDEIATLKDIPVISATDPTFSNAVDRIVRSLIPTTLRAYDPVRQCWWNIQPVNGVLTLTVED